MSYTADQLFSLATKYQKLADEALKITAEKKKLDPKAKVRNRGTVCVPASSAKDHEDHFPINDEDQARNALSQVGKYTSAPPWYNGSLSSLKSLISGKVHSKYPSIGKSEKKKKSYVEVSADLLSKYGQTAQVPDQPYLELDPPDQPKIELDPPMPPKPVAPATSVAPTKPAEPEKKWWETPLLDKEKMDPFTGKEYDPTAKQSSVLSQLMKKYQ